MEINAMIIDIQQGLTICCDEMNKQINIHFVDNGNVYYGEGIPDSDYAYKLLQLPTGLFQILLEESMNKYNLRFYSFI